MALGNYANCLPVTLKYEGGWSDHPADPGGATMRGITLAVYRRYRPGATKWELRAISNNELETIYRDGYWKPIKGDDLPVGIDLATFDFGVNSGVSRASKYLQRAVGVDADGKIGNVTIAALRSANGKEVIQRLCGQRLSFVRALSTFKTFGKGWSRRIADVEARAVVMCLTAGSNVVTPAVATELKAEAVKAESKAIASNRQAASTGTAGTAAGGADAMIYGGPNWTLLGALAALCLVAIVVGVIRSRQHRERALAYLEAMAA